MADQPSIGGPLARIDRANELLTHLDTSLKGFIETRPYVVEELPDPNPKTRAFVLRKLHGVPERPRIIAGEVAHHLRSALDLLAYQLLVKDGINDPKRLRECAFPIITNRDLSIPDGRKRHDASINAKVGGVSRKAHDRIVALQPYATNGEWSHLAQVQELDNTDKHRLLLAAAASMDLKNFAYHDETGKVTGVSSGLRALAGGRVDQVRSGVYRGFACRISPMPSRSWSRGLCSESPSSTSCKTSRG